MPFRDSAPRLKPPVICKRQSNRKSSSRRRSSRSNLLVPRSCMSRPTIRQWFMERGRIRLIRHTPGIRPGTRLAPPCLRLGQALRSALRGDSRGEAPTGAVVRVDIDVNRNTNFNTNINREQAKQNLQARGQREGGSFQHDPSHRKGVGYRDNATAQKFNRGGDAQAAKAREDFRGRAERRPSRIGAPGRSRRPRWFGRERRSRRSRWRVWRAGIRADLAIAEDPVTVGGWEKRVVSGIVAAKV